MKLIREMAQGNEEATYFLKAYDNDLMTSYTLSLVGITGIGFGLESLANGKTNGAVIALTSVGIVNDYLAFRYSRLAKKHMQKVAKALNKERLLYPQ